MTLPQSEHDDLTRLGIIYAVLAPDARLVLMRLANRLEQGQRQYGNLDLARDVRDWLEEQQQERLDELVYGEIYLAAQGVRRGEAGRR